RSGSACSDSSSSMPPVPGIMMSSRMTSGLTSRARESPEPPSFSVATTQPEASHTSRRSCRLDSSSSTARIVALIAASLKTPLRPPLDLPPRLPLIKLVLRYLADQVAAADAQLAGGLGLIPMGLFQDLVDHVALERLDRIGQRVGLVQARQLLAHHLL